SPFDVRNSTPQGLRISGALHSDVFEQSRNISAIRVERRVAPAIEEAHQGLLKNACLRRFLHPSPMSDVAGAHCCALSRGRFRAFAPMTYAVCPIPKA
ncbi:MAG: hypothetical protein JW884_05745, partial [Deltaproteobacteria bacterium]|nr:hypothetical protein [Deltaproteobacteria bacterium]